MSGNYPDGITESTPDAPWNADDCETCAVCGGYYYPDGAPLHVPRDIADALQPEPETDHGAACQLCGVCETENSYCEYCGEIFRTPDGRTAGRKPCPECMAAIKLDIFMERSRGK